MAPPPSSDLTPESLFLSRRVLLGSAAALAVGAPPRIAHEARALAGPADAEKRETTPAAWVTTYNNFYEFGPDKHIARAAQRLDTAGWSIVIDGAVAKPQRSSVDDLVARFREEDRVYRFRCVEAWAMVVPWRGIPLADIVRWAEPEPDARWVRFESFHRPFQAWNQILSFYYPWPYTETLRLDEALHPLALLATGVYGEPLPKQNGAPVRLIVPWKYGFKSIKSIERITFTREAPTSFWHAIAPHEYGLLANVDPTEPHPRWSQASERLLGTDEDRATLPFNGYADEVAGLYP